MSTTFTKIKKWYQITKPHKGYLWAMSLLSFFASVVQIVQAFPTAYVITSITNSDYRGACIWLAIGLGLTALYYVLWHFYYIVQAKQSEYTIKNLSLRIHNKIESADQKSLNQNSVQRLILLLTANISTLDLYSDKIAYMTSYLLRAVLSIIIVMTYNVYVGLAMIGVLVILYFWILFLSVKSRIQTDLANKEREALGEKIADIVSGKEMTKIYANEKQQKEDFLKQAGKIASRYHKRGTLTEARKYWTYIGCYAIITVLTIMLVNMTKANMLSLAVYLVLAPYLIDVIDQATSGMELIYELQAVEVCRARLETVLNMHSSDIPYYANNTFDNLSDSMIFSNVSFVQSGDEETGSIRPTNIELKAHQITLIKGNKGCGKRAIFAMLRRTVKPTTGTITMDGIDIFDFDKSVYLHNFSYATSKPYFYNTSIIENLSYVGANKKEIISVCKKLGIHNLINELPDQYDSNPVADHEYFSPYLLFMLGLARAVCSKSMWIAIYEFPVSLTKLQQKYVKNAILSLKKNHSVIIFSASESMTDICDNMFVITSGSVRKLERRDSND